MDITQRFGEVLSAWQARGILVTDGDWLRLTRAGLLEVDRWVHDFFLPEHRTARYA